jgi:hypothetical protein
MKIALDYDGTVTEDPGMWSNCIDTWRLYGHEVRIVTFRSADEITVDMKDYVEMHMLPVIFCNHQTKHGVCLNLGWDPDVWIDDAPALIDHNDKPWSEEKLNEWRQTLPNRVTEEPESPFDSGSLEDGTIPIMGNL